MILGDEALIIIADKFPELIEEIKEDEGSLHLQIGTFSFLVQSFIDEGEKIEFNKACELFVEIFPTSIPSLENALNVSFLEHLIFKDDKKDRSWAYKLMPPLMRNAWNDMEKYNNSLERNSNK